MNRTWLLIALAGSVLALQTSATATPAAASAPTAQEASESNSPDASALKTKKEKASYAVGMSIGKSLKRDGVDVDPDILLRGMNDTLAGGKLSMTPDEAKTAVAAIQAAARAQNAPVPAAPLAAPLKLPSTYVSAQTPEDQLHLNTDNSFSLHEGGQPYHGTFVANGNTLELTINETSSTTTLSRRGNSLTDSSGQAWVSEGVVILPSGLQYKILTAGTGTKPAATDTVICNYRGTFVDGKEFDSSYKRGKAAEFPVNAVIKGWKEALQLMPVGSKWELFIPPDLAYGESGAGTSIPPNAALIFEVELISVQAK